MESVAVEGIFKPVYCSGEFASLDLTPLCLVKLFRSLVPGFGCASYKASPTEATIAMNAAKDENIHYNISLFW